jgi:hypothetical protein
MNWNPNLILFLIFIGLPLLQWIAQKIKEQRDAAKAKENIRRRQEETLRTGRAPSEDERDGKDRADAKARLEAAQREAMQKRQEQLRELRRKQMQAQAEARARARQTQPTRPRPAPTARAPQPQAPRQSPRTMQAPAPLPQSRHSQPSPAPQRSRAPQPPPVRSAPLERPGGTRPSEFERITAQRRIEAARRQSMLQAQSDESERLGESSVRPMLAETLGTTKRVASLGMPDASNATTSGADLLANMDADDWRRGIVLAEVLGRPISLRDDDHPFWL